ncbi:hypothetical protein OIU77_017309 [Salix suchowensis]|uniref:Uncharacterized protein n=1 Tax=Salix suchowensis TaxID=1278906 RepID=A0ABQ8ZNB9_9ROSI|nr:hypothetical protein OIU77_017309 [Salix suchowensis]
MKNEKGKLKASALIAAMYQKARSKQYAGLAASNTEEMIPEYLLCRWFEYSHA